MSDATQSSAAATSVLSYRHPLPSGRLQVDASTTGFIVRIPPSGMWRRARWGLLIVFSPLFAGMLAVWLVAGLPPATFGSAFIDLIRTEGALLLLYPLPLLFELALFIALFGAFLEGSRRTTVAVNNGVLVATEAGRFRSKTFSASLLDLFPPRLMLGIIQLRTRTERKFWHIRYAARPEARWLFDLLMKACIEAQQKAAAG